jgi:solute carrier family 15 oligopeptide transporter 1
MIYTIAAIYLFQDVSLLTVTQPNSIHMLWLIPQYFVMTMGEVMFSITGLEFSFTQVSILQGCYCKMSGC